MVAGPDPLALELDRLALEFRHMLPAPAPDGSPPADPRDFHAALWASLIATALAAIALGLALGAAFRWANGLPVLGGPRSWRDPRPGALRMPDPAHAPDPAPSGRPWPEPPAPPVARECRLIEVFLGDRLRPVGALSLRALPGHAAEIHFRQAGRDGGGDEFPAERIAFRPADARELLRDLARVVAEMDEIEPPPAARERAGGPISGASPTRAGPGSAGHPR